MVNKQFQPFEKKGKNKKLTKKSKITQSVRLKTKNDHSKEVKKHFQPAKRKIKIKTKIFTKKPKITQSV